MDLIRRLLVVILLATVAVQAQVVPPATSTGSLSATGSVTLNVSGYASIAFQLTGTFTATVTFEGSVDGVTYQAINVTPTNSTSATTTATSTGVWVASVGGLKYVRARVSAYTSGTVVATLQTALAGGGSGGGGGSGSAPSGTIGAAVPSTASPVAVKDNSGNLAYPTLDVSGNLLVAVTGAGSGGTSSVDGSGYTAGTTAGTPLMGARDDTGTTACAEDKNCIARLTSTRALMVDGSATTQPVSGTVAATQSGTWTVQPGNTANTTAWKVDGSAVTQPVSGTVTTSPPSNASSNVAQLAGTTTDTNSGVKSAGTLRVVLATDQPALTNKLLVTPDSVALPANQSVNINQINSVTPLMGNGVTGTGSPRVTIASDNTAFTVNAAQSGTWTVQPGNTANTTAWKVDGSAVTQPISAATLPLPSLAATSTKQSDGTQKTQIVDGSGNVIASTSNNLNVQCANCSGSGVSAADEAAFTAGTSLFAAGGGFFQTTATSNALTTGQQGAFQVTANRALFSNLRNAAGTEVGTSTTPLQVSLANTGANTSKLLVTPDSVALPNNQSVNVSQVNGVTLTTGAGATGTGVQRINDVASSATGAAPPASAAFVAGLGSGATGGFLTGITVCDTHKPVSMTSATTTLMVTGVSGRHVRICSVQLVTAIANNVAIVSGTGATCGTGTAGIAGGSTAANGFNFAANGGITVGSGLGEVMRTVATGDSVCIITSAAGPLSGNISYAIY